MTFNGSMKACICCKGVNLAMVGLKLIHKEDTAQIQISLIVSGSSRFGRNHWLNNKDIDMTGIALSGLNSFLFPFTFKYTKTFILKPTTSQYQRAS